MTKQSNMMKSNFPRVPGDYYPTIDRRVVQALVESYPGIFGKIVDCCAPQGSGIVDGLWEMGHTEARGEADAYGNFRADWIVTNPPYTRGLVDSIMRYQLQRLDKGEIIGFACLLRTGFDHGSTYADMFQHSDYAGQLKMLFRPKWFETIPGKKEVTPFHNFVWHIWDSRSEYERIRYWPLLGEMHKINPR